MQMHYRRDRCQTANHSGPSLQTFVDHRRPTTQPTTVKARQASLKVQSGFIARRHCKYKYKYIAKTPQVYLSLALQTGLQLCLLTICHLSVCAVAIEKSSSFTSVAVCLRFFWFQPSRCIKTCLLDFSERDLQSCVAAFLVQWAQPHRGSLLVGNKHKRELRPIFNVSAVNNNNNVILVNFESELRSCFCQDVRKLLENFCSVALCT